MTNTLSTMAWHCIYGTRVAVNHELLYLLRQHVLEVAVLVLDAVKPLGGTHADLNVFDRAVEHLACDASPDLETVERVKLLLGLGHCLQLLLLFVTLHVQVDGPRVCDGRSALHVARVHKPAHEVVLPHPPTPAQDVHLRVRGSVLVKAWRRSSKIILGTMAWRCVSAIFGTMAWR